MGHVSVCCNVWGSTDGSLTIGVRGGSLEGAQPWPTPGTTQSPNYSLSLPMALLCISVRAQTTVRKPYSLQKAVST